MNNWGEKAVAEAKTWLNTPYHHMGKIKGVGVDCGQFLIAVFENIGYLQKGEIQPGYYPPDWHLHRDEERYLGWVKSRCREVPEAQPGDIAIFRFGRCVSHGGIVLLWPQIIHAYLDYGVLISSVDEPLLTDKCGQSRLAGIYRPRDLTE
jgi:cell wall-associated NlpC family hydrolase